MALAIACGQDESCCVEMEDDDATEATSTPTDVYDVYIYSSGRVEYADADYAYLLGSDECDKSPGYVIVYDKDELLNQHITCENIGDQVALELDLRHCDVVPDDDPVVLENCESLYNGSVSSVDISFEAVSPGVGRMSITGVSGKGVDYIAHGDFQM